MIIDASVAFKLLVREPGSTIALEWIGSGPIHAPALLHAEVANALWKSIQRGELPGDAETAAMLARLDRLITYLDEGPIMPRALMIAVGLKHAVYDCIYLALAEARVDKVLTADDKFVRKAAAAGYGSLVQPLEATA